MFLKYKTIYNTVQKEGKKASSSSSILGLRRTNTNQNNKIMCIVACCLLYSTCFLYIMKGFATQKRKHKKKISKTKIPILSAPFCPVTVPYNVNSAQQKRDKKYIYFCCLQFIYI